MYDFQDSLLFKSLGIWVNIKTLKK
jgi:hypothetical protein